ncbi:hypothetical protein VE00_10583 [Pseudogymnoascus sp. WSF 3629]|nr:hypothetical protein VE00_10583 [Pseudogymnoascus sp. WSF 3629]
MLTSLPFLALWALAAPIVAAAATPTRAPGLHVSTVHGHRTCTVLPRGNKKDDAHNFSDDTSYWRENSYYIAFQNHRAGFILSGDNINVDGYNSGGINGNGDFWYDEDKGISTEGRPMPFVLWNITDSSVDNFFVKQPQF